MSEFPIARAFADVRVDRITASTSKLMKEIIARKFIE
jgi:alkylation response protein AidB-like acyl-CoA dehydrogenase